MGDILSHDRTNKCSVHHVRVTPFEPFEMMNNLATIGEGESHRTHEASADLSFPALLHVEPIKHHDLVPSLRKVSCELLLAASDGIGFSHGAQFRIRTEH